MTGKLICRKTFSVGNKNGRWDSNCNVQKRVFQTVGVLEWTRYYFVGDSVGRCTTLKKRSQNYKKKTKPINIPLLLLYGRTATTQQPLLHCTAIDLFYINW